MTKLKFSSLVFLIAVSFLNCNNQPAQKEISADKLKSDTSINTYAQLLTLKEKLSTEKNTDTLGDLISKIDFQVRTNNLSDYKEGFIPYITIENPEKEIKDLIDGDKIEIDENKVTVIIDYPLDKAYQFDIVSGKGFTRKMLIEEISKHYHEVYDEEERTATIKTVPINKRTKMYNRNQTNGKYGIWGHDMADLVLADILVYKRVDGRIVLSLEMES